ncbi:hypothetical protein BDW75DRAFT_232590 [Aspergillus navahoensis]
MQNRDTRRRRNALACDTCRARRTKCDGQRPKCTFCTQRGKDCFYQQLHDMPPSTSVACPLEFTKVELSRIWEQLDHITAIVLGQSSQNDSSPKGRQGHRGLPNRDGALGFPIMTAQNEAFANLVGLDQNFSVHLEHAERSRQILPTQPSGDGIAMVDLQRASILLKAFGEQIHTWYPILHAEFTDEFIQSIASCFPPSAGSCLTLLVLAIGSVLECESIADALRRRPEALYIQTAMEMLPDVFADSSPRGAQCLLLFALYHLCYAQPCQAHDYVAMASYKLQNDLVNDFGTDDDAARLSIFANCFWSALLIESEITVQLDLAHSGIWNMSSFAPVPTSSGPWTWTWPRPLSQYCESPTSSIGESEQSYCPNSDLSYFIAEIAMRKMLQRCTWSITTFAEGTHVYAPIVAAELERQLDEWLQLLPEPLSFQSSRCNGLRPWQTMAQAEFLRTQYYAFKASIYWPAVYEAIMAMEANDNLRRHCERFFRSYTEFVTSAAAAVTVCRPNLWTLYTSVFTISMGTLTALAEPCLAEVVPQGVVRSLELAVEIFAGVTEISPSLAEMGTILKERVSRGNSYLYSECGAVYYS